MEETLPELAEHTSQRERRAIEAERDTDELKKAEYMIQHIGDEFEGIKALLPILVCSLNYQIQ